MGTDRFAIAIDGPGGAGKSTVARRVAQALQIIYVDTGAMYRAVALYNLRQGADISDENAVAASLSQIHIEILYTDNDQRLLLNGDDVTEALRTLSAAESASMVAPYKAVRRKMVAIQQEIARNKRVVMDGRDIGSDVLPWAQVKVYLDASLEARVKRRIAELSEKRMAVNPPQVYQEIKLRDERDMNRAVSPLKRAGDAVYIDTSDMGLEQVVDKIVALANDKITKG
jgi:cytidylate kinase